MATMFDPTKSFTELTPELTALSRQQKMAELLTAKGLQTPQAQMVGDVYVPANPLQYLGNLFNVYAGSRMSEQAEQEAQKLAQQLKAKEAQDISSFYENLYGNPNQVIQQAGPTPEGGNIPPEVVPLPANPQKAYQIAAASQSPVLRQQLAEMLKGQKLGEGEVITRFNPVTGKMENVASGAPKYRAPIQVDAGNRYELRDPLDPTKILQVIPKSLSPSDVINMQFEGKLGGGMPFGGGAMSNMGVQPNVVAQTGATAQVKKENEKFIPVVMPQYEYNPQLSPKQNQEMAMKFNEKNLNNINNAKDSFDYLKQAAQILASNKPSSGRLENIVTGTREFFGGGGEASKTDAQLNVLAGGLTMKQPRFEGPQGVLDVQLYQKLAGDVGNPNVPIASRLGAIQQMIDLQKKYYPNADWESIDISGPVVKKNVLGGTRGLGAKTMSPTEFKQNLAPQDKEAFEWAIKNPNDPRSAQIKKRLGVE